MRTCRIPRFALLLLALGAGPGASAQDEPDFEIDDPATTTRWQPFGELLLRGDRVSGLPAGREDLERARLRARLGGVWNGDAVTVGVAVEGAVASGANADNLANNDVEKADAVGLDQLWFRWPAGEQGAFLVGKAPMPLQLTPLTWDDDLRPYAVAARWGGALGEFDRWQLDVGGFAPDPLGETGARLAAVQLGWHWREGAPTSAGVLLGYLDWHQLDGYARAGLGRGNSLAGGRHVHDFRVLDVQGWLRRRAGEKSLEARVDLARNLGADDGADRDGVRASLVYGDRFLQPGWELGWSWQRIQRDAVVAAVTADDWWFHAAARGHMPWVGYGFSSVWSVRLAAFFETRDGLDERTERVLLDIEARW